MQFSHTFFSGNRQRLIDVLPDTLVVIPAHKQMQYSADMAYPFRQDSNFWYLSGLNASDCMLVINTKTTEETILLPETSDYHEAWDGAFDKQEAADASGIRDYAPMKKLESIIKQAKATGLGIGYLEPLSEIAEPYGFYTNPSRRLLAELLNKLHCEPKDIRLDIARLCQIKQAEEVAVIRRAIEITGESLAEIKQNLKNYKREKVIERDLTAGFYSRGADGHAYEPIIASGQHAATIHYNRNDSNLSNDSLLLLDVGALYEGYAADISRTWAYGSPTARMQEVAEVVLKLQDIAFGMLGPGVKIRDYQAEMEVVAKKAAAKIGIKIDEYPHGFSHFLGLDVHDAGDYAAPLVAGSVLTVEPGLYLQDEGIGVRFEDNILITENGYENLSANIPRTL